MLCTSCLLLLSIVTPLVGARRAFSTIPDQRISTRSLPWRRQVHVDFALRYSTYLWRFEDAERRIGNGRSLGVGDGLRCTTTVYAATGSGHRRLRLWRALPAGAPARRRSL